MARLAEASWKGLHYLGQQRGSYPASLDYSFWAMAADDLLRGNRYLKWMSICWPTKQALFQIDHIS